MVEFWEVLISTLSGFTIAFFAEPVKLYLSQKNKKARLRESLYREMIHVYNGFGGLLYNISEGNVGINVILSNREPLSRFDCYNYAKSDETVLQFYELEEATTIDIVYKNFTFVFSDVMKTDEDRYIRIKTSMKVFDEFVIEGKLDKALFLKLGWQQAPSYS